MTVCDFCKGQPVGDAGSWTDGKPRPAAQCPRCGETHHYTLEHVFHAEYRRALPLAFEADGEEKHHAVQQALEAVEAEVREQVAREVEAMRSTTFGDDILNAGEVAAGIRRGVSR